MRVLIITYSYAPHLSPRSLRWGAIAEHWAELGHEVEVVSGWLPGAEHEEALNGVYVHRAGGNLEGRFRNRFSAPRPNDVEISRRDKLISAGVIRMARNVAQYLYSRTWKNLYWPDHNCLWYFSAIRQCRRVIKRNAPDAIISSSLPFTGHLVGRRLKRQYPTIPWVLDVGDPFCFMDRTPTNNHALYHRLNFAADKKMFRDADAISVTNSTTAEIYSRLFPESEDRIRVISPLLKPNDGGPTGARFFADDSRIRLVYMGTLYPSVRSPERLLRLFDRLLKTPLGKRLELHFVGETKGCEKYFQAYRMHFDKKLFLHGTVSHAVAQDAMKSCNFLVNIGNITSYQLPSKIVDYAAACKPILNIETAREDSSAAFLETYPAALSLPVLSNELPSDSDKAEEKQLSRAVRFLEKSHRIDPDEHELWCRDYQVDAISRDYEHLIESACRRVQLDLPERTPGPLEAENQKIPA